jgi:hypothetical protein
VFYVGKNLLDIPSGFSYRRTSEHSIDPFRALSLAGPVKERQQKNQSEVSLAKQYTVGVV